MKAKSRRRLLISSVAMLLVAMLALGTATFAWFTVDTTTQAQGLNVKTTKRSTLEISSNKLDWTGGTLNYNFSNKTLKPASSYDGINWYYAQADEGGDKWAATNGNKVDMTVNDDATTIFENASEYVFYNQLNIRNAGAAAVTDVTIKFTLNETPANTKRYLRLALVPATAAGKTGVVADTDAFKTNTYTGTDAACGIYASADNEKAKPVQYVGASTTDTSGAITAATSDVTAKNGSGEITITVGDLAAASDTTAGAVKEKDYMLFVWFEGQDPECADLYSGNVMPAITFAVDGTPATT